jgi:hypothetical protein
VLKFQGKNAKMLQQNKKLIDPTYLTQMINELPLVRIIWANPSLIPDRNNY